MINNAAESPHVHASRTSKEETGTSLSTTSGQPRVSSRDPLPSLLDQPSLHSAARTGDIEALFTAFSFERSAINEIDPETGLTPLQTALANGQRQAARHLIGLGARVHDVQPDCAAEDVSLHAASESGNLKLLEEVLKLSPGNVCEQDPISGLTPLALALRGNYLDAAKMLLAAGADIDHKDNGGRTALHKATCEGNEEKVEFLLASSADSRQVDGRGRTALFDAVLMRERAIIHLLLDYGTDIEHADRDGNTALCEAAAFGCVDEGKILLARGADQKYGGGLLGTPIMIAAGHGRVEFLKLLLPAEKRLLDTKDFEENTALHLAAESGADAAVQLLIDAGADINLVNDRKETPLKVAFRKGHLSAAMLLLDSEPDLLRATKRAQSLLKYAVKNNNAQAVELLLKRNADVDDEERKLAKSPVMADLLRLAPWLHSGETGDADDSVMKPLDGNELTGKLLSTSIDFKDADYWDTYLTNRHVSNTVSRALQSAAEDTRPVWKSLAGQGQKITPAQQKNWCAGIVADVGDVMPQKSSYAEIGLTPATRTLLETIATQQCHALVEAGRAAEQPLRAGMAELLQTCMKAVSDDQFYPIDLYKLLTMEHGMYHEVASLIVTAFADFWPRRNSLGGVSQERTFAEKLSALKRSRRTLQSMNSSSAGAENLQTVNMLMFRQLDLLQEWLDKALK